MSPIALPVENSMTATSPMSLTDIGVVIPTFNAADGWIELQAALDQQGISTSQVMIIDSSSSDNTAALAKKAGYQLVTIATEDFRHGGTRQAARDYLPSARILVYMTQDAVLASRDSIERLCRAFDDPQVGAAFGRQIPREQADPIERHARSFNYSATSDVRTLQSRERLGIKAAFLSNSFAAYRRSAMDDVGGFPTHVIVAEDSVIAARLLIAGWKIAYKADAAVIHSHPMTLKQEFARYFDTGVHHAREHWLLEQFGHASQEGLKFVISELRYLRSNAQLLIPQALLRTLGKWIAYQLGRREKHLPIALKRALTGNPQFW